MTSRILSTHSSRTLWAILLLAITALAASAQGPNAAPAAAIGIHIVRPGDTLRLISRRFSGGEQHWEANWKLNPEIQNPNLLEPGQKVHIYLEPQIPADMARITRLARTVDAKPTPIDWDTAVLDSLLRDQDALRTRGRSSAEMSFGDGSQLRVTENSLVLLRRFGKKLQGVSRDEIEIVEGQADLDHRAPRHEAKGIDIVLGSTRLSPQIETGSALAARARKPETGGAAVMMYEGKSAVESAGSRVDVARGMGTRVEEGQAPGPPEPLLEAPRLLTPATDARYDYAHPKMEWTFGGPVEKLSGFIVEVCSDPECAQLVTRSALLNRTQVLAEPLPVGRHYWRVTARAKSGLDGYPSAAVAFATTSDRVDYALPAVEIFAEGIQIRCGENLVLGKDTRLVTRASDALTGITTTAYFGAEGKAIDRSTFTGPWAAGEHTVKAVVVDGAGNRAESFPFRFISDPEPPVATWELGGEELIRRYGRPDRAEEALSKRGRRNLEREGVVLEWSADGALWLPLRRSQVTPTNVAFGDKPQLLLRSRLGDPFAAVSPAHLPDGKVLRIRFEDQACGVGQVSFGVSGNLLWIDATDLLGNSSRQEWPLLAVRR